MRILIATTQVPFVRGGAEMHAENLREALREAGHEADIAAIPFKWYPPEKILDHMLACRLLDLTEAAGAKIDLLIGLKFPAYLISHPNKVLWILHQHRAAYDMWDHPDENMSAYPNAQSVRDLIRQTDQQFIPQARAVFANSRNVAARLKKFCDLDATPLYHPPPHAEEFYCAADANYFFYPSRFCPAKRQTLVLEALARTASRVRVRFAGAPERPAFSDELASTARALNVADRVEWLGRISEEEKRKQYAHATGVIYTPIDEDYGYVSLEAMLASKPLIVCSDSGGALEFVGAGENGLVVDPQPATLAAAMDTLWGNRERARRMGENGRHSYDGRGITWQHVVRQLVV